MPYVLQTKGELRVWLCADGQGVSESPYDAYCYTEDGARAKVAELPECRFMISHGEMASRYRKQQEPTMSQDSVFGRDFSIGGESARPGDTGAARKMDAGKAPLYQGFDKYFPRAKLAVSMVSEYGDRKYAIGSLHYTTKWCEVPDGFNRYYDGQQRHQTKAEIEGPYDDSDSGLPHLAQEAWNAMAKLERAIKDGAVEIRRGNDIVDGKPVLGTARAV